MKLRVGVVGLGEAWETRHRPALRSLRERFEVRAVCDQVAHRAKQAAQEFDAVAVDGFRALSCREDIDAIFILAEQWFGTLPILAACDAGKAVYCGSPLDWDGPTSSTIRQRVEAAGVVFMAEFPRRHAPATIRLKELIATRLGRPKLVFCHRRVSLKDVESPLPRGKLCSATNQDLIELVDWCRYVVGREPTSVIGLFHKVRPDSAVDDYKMMSLDFSEQAPGTEIMAQISSGYYMPARWEEAVSYRPPAALQVACENGIAFIDLPTTLVWFDTAGRHQESLDSERPVGEQLLAQFHRQVTSFVHNNSGLEDASRALAAVQGAKTSYEEGRRVPLN
ncbi:MAG TPA: Gfo/Idh/MocA family oxidoreductase [Pirellulales bacterium]|jgi:predicted dehydrogenase|nr:Gfo/Idh/MocA family oxidoreductase [Pirellulales bacterium]